MSPIAPTFTFPDGLRVARLGLGAMRLTGQPGNFGPYPDWEGGRALLRRAVELGIGHVDTARAYGPGWSEELVADALAPYPPGLLIATKGGIEKNGPTSAHIRADGRPEALRAHAEESLRRLRTEAIGLYYLHRPDPAVPFVDSVGALEEMRRAGRIEHIGISNVTLTQLQEAMTIGPISAVQNRYNPADGGDEVVLDFTTRHGIAFVPWGPLGADPMVQGAPLAGGKAQDGLTPSQRALRALLARAPNILPIPGTTSPVHLEENMAALADREQAA